MAVKIPIITVFDSKGLRQAQFQLNKVRGNFQNIGRNIAIAGAAIGGFAAVSVKAFADFDAALTKSTAIMGNMSDEMRTKMSNTARDVAKATTFSASQAAEAYFFLASAGLDAESSIAALPQVARFAQAGMFDMALATDLLTDAQSALGMVIKGDSLANLEEMTRLSDVLVKANTLANASVQQFSEALTTKAGAALKAVNKDVTEGVAVLAAFADQGIKGAAAGTQFSIIMRDLTTKAIQNKNAFAAAGISVFDTAGNMNNLGDIIGDLEGALAGMSDETQKATLLQLGFSDKSLASLTALLGTSDAIKTYEASLRSASGFTNDVAGKQLDTFNAQVQLLQSAFTDVGISVGQQLEPALRNLIPQLQAALPLLGEKLVAAISDIDFVSLANSIVDLTVFLIENAETIGKVITALFLLNTAFNLSKIAVGVYNAAAVILGNTFVVTAGKIGLATGAVKLFRTALITTGIGALVVGLGFIIEAIINTNKAAEEGKPAVDNYGGAIRKSGADAEWAAGKYGIATKAVKDYSDAVSRMPRPTFSSAAEDRRFESFRPGALPSIPGIVPPALTGGAGGGGGGAGSVTSDPTGLRAWTASNKKEARISAKEIELISKGLSADVARSIVGSNTPLKTANQAIQRINKNGTKAINNLTKSFQNSAAGQQAAAAQAAAAAEQAAQAAAAAAQAAAEQARREAEILAEKQRVYEAFAFSVTSTFGRIKDAILGAFSLPELGGSTNSIIRNMDKLLVRVRAFSQNITRLSDMGLDPKLLQQVINAGPIAGAKLAANLVSGGVAGLNTINRGFSELGGLATDIGTTGTQAAFRGEAQQNIYNLTINGGLDSGASIGKAVVDAIKAYERTSGVVFQGA
jgi:TP901 family phage tail tape measure protein